MAKKPKPIGNVFSFPEQSKTKGGFVRPVRDSYRHSKCGTMTTMRRHIAETYARYPKLFEVTFCTNCQDRFPVGQFTWCENDGSKGPKVGT